MNKKDYLFSTRKLGRVLLTIGQSCPSNCFNCNNRFLGKKYYSYEDLKKNISFIGNNFSRNFECLLFFTNTIYHDDILKFVSDSILSSFDVFTLQIHPRYDSSFEKKVVQILNVNNKVVFHICNYYLNETNYNDVINFITNVIKFDTDFDMDLFFDFIKYKKYLKSILRLYPWNINIFHDLNGKKAIKLDYRNIQINLYFQGEQKIINDYISNVYYKKCISYDSFKLENNSILIDEEVMILPDGTITFHRNTLCSKSIKSISHIKKSRENIYKDFITLKNKLNIYNKGDMKRNCFKCINNPININEK